MLGRDFRARSSAHQSVDDDAVVRFKARSDHPQAASEISGFHDLRHHGGVRRNRHDQMLRLIEHHRRIRQQQSGRGCRDSHAKPRELTGREKQIRIWHRRAGVDRSARAIESVIDEIEGALPFEVGLVTQAERDLVGERAAKARAFARKGQVIGFAHVEVEIERIERNQRCEQGRRADGCSAAGDKARRSKPGGRRCVR